MIHRLRNMAILIIITLNSFCFLVTCIKQLWMYPLLLENSNKEYMGWNLLLSSIWKYSEIALIAIVVGLSLLYWIKRNEINSLQEIKIIVGICLSMIAVEWVISFLFHIPIGNSIQPTLWVLYDCILLIGIAIINKWKKK